MRDGDYLSALDGTVIRDMNVRNMGGECIRLRGKHVSCARAVCPAVVDSSY